MCNSRTILLSQLQGVLNKQLYPRIFMDVTKTVVTEVNALFP